MYNVLFLFHVLKNIELDLLEGKTEKKDKETNLIF